MNVEKDFKVYWATNICRGFVSIPKPKMHAHTMSDGETSQVVIYNKAEFHIKKIFLDFITYAK